MPPITDWLVQLIQYFANNAMQNGKPQIVLEKTSSAQNQCFWKGIAHVDGVEIHWGIVGTSGNRRFIPLTQCKFHNPIWELRKRMDEKLNKTYTLKQYDFVTI